MSNETHSWMTVSEAAEYLRVKPRSLLLWVRQGTIPAYALSGTKRRVWRFLQSDLDTTLKANRIDCLSPTVLLED